MQADFPPSSSEEGTRLRPVISPMCRPTSEPVKVTMLTPGCPIIVSPMTVPSPVTMLTTPGGSPTSSKMSIRAKVDSGVTSEGLSTTVHPAARAGATLAAIWWSG